MKGETNGNHKRKGRPLRPGDPCEKIQQPASIRIPHRKYNTWPVWRDMAEIYGRKYMTHAELSRYEVPATAGFIELLHGIESEVLGKEATT